MIRTEPVRKGLRVSSVGISMEVGSPLVVTTQNRGMNAEEWADLAVNKIVGVSINSSPLIREQALTYKSIIRALLVGYFEKVAESERGTLRIFLEHEGYSDLARRL